MTDTEEYRIKWAIFCHEYIDIKDLDTSFRENPSNNVVRDHGNALHFKRYNIAACVVTVLISKCTTKSEWILLLELN